MKKKIFLRRVLHRDHMRIAIFFDYNDDVKTMVKKIQNVSYSATLKCFYLDDTEENLKKIMQTLRDHLEIDISALSLPSETKKLKAELKEVHAEKKEIDEFTANKPQQAPAKKAGNKVYSKKPFEVVFRIDEEAGLIVIRFPGGYDQEWITEMETFGKVNYNHFQREWSLKWSRIAVDSLSDYFSSLGLTVTTQRTESPAGVRTNREQMTGELKEKEITQEAIDGLDNVKGFMTRKRYSKNTIESYLSHLGTFFRYFSEKDPAEISASDITSFFSDFITQNKYSASYQNQVISAIKIYYSINPGDLTESFTTGRPRRSRSLPKVLSKEEVSSVLNSTRNLKHRLILWMIYSCGLRRSEVINIRLDDLNRDRSVLSIVEGKGMVDRVVPVSAKVWDKIDEYMKSYHPTEWLFEGQYGGRYSSESVYHIFKEAMKRAGIKKDVGVHCLRHSYATHLHENGLDIRFIQELLGHKSTRTTEIYTHVSRRNLILVRSPIEDLDLK